MADAGVFALRGDRRHQPEQQHRHRCSKKRGRALLLAHHVHARAHVMRVGAARVDGGEAHDAREELADGEPATEAKSHGELRNSAARLACVRCFNLPALAYVFTNESALKHQHRQNSPTARATEDRQPPAGALRRLRREVLAGPSV